MRFKERRTITVTLSNGHRIKVSSPYFVKAQPHHKRSKRGPNGTSAHLGLDILGLIGYASPGRLADVLQMALLCTSYDVAGTILKGRGIKLNVKAIRRLCRIAGT